MRLIGKVAEPDALNCLHAEAAGGLEFVGSAVAYVETFLGCDVQGLHGKAIDFWVGFEKSLLVRNHGCVEKWIKRGIADHVALVGKGVGDKAGFEAFFAESLKQPERFGWDGVEGVAQGFAAFLANEFDVGGGVDPQVFQR